MSEYAWIIKIVISLLLGVGLFLIYYGFNRWRRQCRAKKEDKLKGIFDKKSGGIT